jgi:hypothetical protein
LEVHKGFAFKDVFDFWEQLNGQLDNDLVQGLPKIRQKKIEL